MISNQVVSRRAFLRWLGACGAVAVVPRIWFPLTPQVGDKAQLPSGLGLAINLDGPEDDRDEAFEQAVAAFNPGWCYHWRCWPATGRPGFLPQIVPHPWCGNPEQWYDEALLRSYRRVMAEAGRDVSRAPWLLGNEPEWSGWTPEQIVQTIAAQADVMHQAGIQPHVIAPGGSIKELGYLRRWHEAAQRAGLDYTLAIHLFDWREWRLDGLWSDFCEWFDSAGIDRVLVTECGAGPNRTVAEWLRIMPWFYRLLDDQRVAALAPATTYPATMSNGDRYPGFMDQGGRVNELGQQWIAERDRRA